ncbi:hypothetical protein ACFWUP_16395 [Nocardia sp. NPDC058658]|uniref:hypothetical protein n=1 Tax=Nocardia sp. NPDC058658 TaxID=3346580 RepID=UPI00364F340A
MKSIAVRVLCAVGALFFGAGALFGAAQPVNAAGYLLGFGEEVTVHVERGSVGSFGRDSEPGLGRVVADGREVQLFDVRSDETVSARMVLIDLGKGLHAYRSASAATADFLWLFGVLAMGVPALVFGLVAFVIGRKPPEDDSSPSDEHDPAASRN